MREDLRCGRKRGGRTSELIVIIHSVLDVDRRVFLKTISILLEVGVANVYRIIYEDLDMSKICAKFVSRALIDEHKKSALVTAER